MLLALLLSLASAVPQADGSDPITVKVNHERFSRGDHARVYVQTAQDGYLVVLHADPEGRVRVLFPRDPTDDAFVRGGRKQEIRGRAGRDAFMVEDVDGAGTVLATVSPDAFTFDGYVLNGHWDYRALGQGTVKDDPLAGLLDIARHMSGDNRFDYDVASYVVEGGRDIAAGYGYGHGYGYGYGYPRFGYAYDPFYDPFCYDRFWGCGYRGFGFGVGFGFGNSFYPRRPYRYVFGRPFVLGRPRVVIPATSSSRGRFIPVEPRPRSGSVDAPPTRSFGGSGTRSVAPRDRGGDRGGRSVSGGRPSAPRGGSVSRPAGRPSGGGGRGGSGGGRRH
jgi:hypothetical protein